MHSKEVYLSRRYSLIVNRGNVENKEHDNNLSSCWALRLLASSTAALQVFLEQYPLSCFIFILLELKKGSLN